MSLHNYFSHSKLSSLDLKFKLSNKQIVKSSRHFPLVNIWQVFFFNSKIFPSCNYQQDPGLVTVITVSLETFIPTALSVISGSSYYCDNKCSTVLAAYTHADLILSSFCCLFPAGNYMFKVNNRNIRTRCEICSKVTIKTLIHNSFQF